LAGGREHRYAHPFDWAPILLHTNVKPNFFFSWHCAEGSAGWLLHALHSVLSSSHRLAFRSAWFYLHYNPWCDRSTSWRSPIRVTLPRVEAKR